MSTNTKTNRLSTIKNKAVVLTVQEVKVPDPSLDILSSFRANSAARTDTSNEWTIDVLPNMVPILMYVMNTALQHANVVQHREHSKSTVATICLYYMSVVYGFFLLNDMFVRPAPSAHARSWHNVHWKHDFANFLLSLPMPEFLSPILSQFHCFTTDRTKNVFFVPSAAGYDHDQFFGRVFPLNMFAEIHDCTATLPGNSTRNQVLQDLYSRSLYCIRNPAFTCVIPDLIGITLNQTTNTTANYMNSRLHQVFNAVFNPVLFRDSQRRSSLAALSLRSPTYPSNHINAYDLMFAANSANMRELKVVLESVSAVLIDHVPFKMTLSQFISEGSSSAILKHGYSSFALPTWSYNVDSTKTNTFGAVTLHTLVSEEDRAQDISFLQRPATDIPHTHAPRDVYYATAANPNNPINIPANHVITRCLPFALRLNAAAANGFPRVDNNDLVSFSDDIDTNPAVLVLDTDGDLTVTAHLATISGKIIESFELDGSTIEMPDARKSLGLQNCLFADSAIPYKYVRPGSAYHPVPAGSILPPLNRAVHNNRPRLPASSLLHDRTAVMLPQVNTLIAEENPAAIPGFTLRTPVNVLRYIQSFLGFRTVDESNNDAALDAVPGMPENNLILWSPYTYTAYEGEQYPGSNLSSSRHYYLTNLRTIFGTDYNLVQVKHPYEAMPV